MKKTIILLIITLPLLFNSCASILNGGTQELEIESSNPKSVIFVNDKKVGTGKAIDAEVKRDFKVQQVKIETEGYMTDFHVINQESLSPFYYMSIVPFGILFLPPFFDPASAYAWNYESLYKYEPRTSKLTWNPELKRIHLDKVAMNIGKGKHEAYLLEYDDYRSGEFDPDETGEMDSIDYKDTHFSNILFKELKKQGFVDTVNTIFKENHNLCKLDATVIELYYFLVREIGTRYTTGFYTAESKVVWTLKNMYDKHIYSDTIVVSSGEYVTVLGEKDNAWRLARADVIERSLYEFLNTKELQENAKRDERTNVAYDSEISIKKPKAALANLDDAMKATVSIKNKDGHGSGIFVSNDGYLLTNYHVVAESEDDLEVILNNGEKAKAELIRFNDIYDLALLKVKHESEYAYLIPTDKNFSTGEEIYAIGTPKSLELGQSLTKGIISSQRKYKSYDWIQADVSVSPGNSGGSIVNKKGELIGIVDFKIVGYGFEGLSFCIPAFNIQKILNVSYN